MLHKKLLVCLLLSMVCVGGISAQQISSSSSTTQNNLEDDFTKLGFTITAKAWFSMGDVEVHRKTDNNLKTRERYLLEEMYPILNITFRPPNPDVDFFSIDLMFGGTDWINRYYKEKHTRTFTFTDGNTSGTAYLNSHWEGEVDGYSYMYGIFPTFRLVHTTMEDVNHQKFDFSFEVSLGYLFQRNKFDISNESNRRTLTFDPQTANFGNSDEFFYLNDLGVEHPSTEYALNMYAFRIGLNLETKMPYGLYFKTMVGFYPVAHTYAKYRWRGANPFVRMQKGTNYFDGGLDLDVAFGWAPLRTEWLDITLTLGFRYFYWNATNLKERVNIDTGMDNKSFTRRITNEQWGPYAALIFNF